MDRGDYHHLCRDPDLGSMPTNGPALVFHRKALPELDPQDGGPARLSLRLHGLWRSRRGLEAGTWAHSQIDRQVAGQCVCSAGYRCARAHTGVAGTHGRSRRGDGMGTSVSVKALPRDGPLRTTPLAEFDIARVVAKPGAALEECFLLEWQPSRETTGLFGVCLVSISKGQERE